MFKTFKDSLVEVEQLYNNKNYHATVVESAKLAERAISIFFNHFHTFLNDKKEWLTYLEFEKQSGEKYATFLKRPTIGVAINYYTQLLDLFPGQLGLTQEIRKHLNTINTIRNAHVHSSARTIDSDEAGAVLDALEKILVSTNLTKLSTSVVGVPIKYYLVLRSIIEKYERAESESDFKKIVDDSLKILPSLLNILLNRVYHDLSIEKKEKLIELYSSTVEEKKNNELHYYIQLCEEIDFERIFEKGASLKESLAAIKDDLLVNYNRRQTRHYVNVLEIIAELSDNPESKHFLEFADSVKKRYLVKHSLSERDRIVLEEKASEFKISKDLASRIEESVIHTIEKELILFQTLTAEDAEPVVVEAVQKKKSSIKMYALAGLLLVAILSIGAWFIFGKGTSDYTDYEKAYFSFDWETANELAESKRSLKDVKANYYFIQSHSNKNYGKILPEVVTEYRNLLKANPESPEAQFYLGMIYNLNAVLREEYDSAVFLLLRSQESLKSMEMDFVLNNVYEGIPTYQIKITDRLADQPNPRTKLMAGEAVLRIKLDTARAKRLYKESIEAYPDYVAPYLRLAGLYIHNLEFDSAREALKSAYAINPQNDDIIRGLADLSREEGKFEEAKKYFRDAIKDFAADDPSFYSGLIDLLFTEDSIPQAKEVLNESLKKFPNERLIVRHKFSIEMREKSIAQMKDSEVRIEVDWAENLEEGIKRAAKMEKPVLVNFFSPGNFWATYMDRKIYTDASVQELMSEFITVKVNVEMRPDLRKKYSIKSLPFIHILNSKGEKVSELGKFYNVPEFKASLGEALNHFRLISSAEDAGKNKLTEVSSFEDARIIAKTKRIPIVMVVGDDRSMYSKRFLNESMSHPLVKASMSNVAYLYLNKNSSDPVLSQLEINTYPSLFFFSPEGKQVHHSFGSIPGLELSKKIEDLKKGIPQENEVNWFYHLEEAKAYALLKKKNMFLSFFSNSCEACSEMDQTFSDKDVIRELNENFVNVSLNINTKEGFELWQSLGVFATPGQLILTENGDELFRKYYFQDATQLLNWIDIREKMGLVSILGIEQYKVFSEENFLAKEFIDASAYLAATEILKKQIKAVPEYADLNIDLANCYYNLKKADETIDSFEEALKAGAKLSEKDISIIIGAFVMNKKLQQAPAWFANQLTLQNNNSNQSYLYLGIARSQYYLANASVAETQAKLAIGLNPKLKVSYALVCDILLDEKKPEAALQYIDKAEKIFGDDPVLLAYKGLCFEKMGNAAKKSANFSQAMSLHNFVSGMISKDELLFMDNFEQYPNMTEIIRKGYENGLKIKSDNTYNYYRLGILCLMEGRAHDAIASFQKVLEDEPTPLAKAGLCAAMHAIGKPENAIDVANDLEASIPVEFMRPMSFYALGLHYKYLQKKEEAKEYFTKAVKYREPEAWERHFQKLAEQELTSI